MRTLVIGLCALVLTSSACNKNESATGTPDAAPPVVTPAATPAPAATQTAPVATAAATQKVEIEIASVGDTMAFDKTTLTVPTGAEVHLKLKNNGTSAAMTHNWVLVKPGTEAATALAGLEKASKSGYVVPGPDVLAYTPMAPPKGNAEVTFTAPAPGKYPYICTFPGHYILMKGVLTVTP